MTICIKIQVFFLCFNTNVQLAALIAFLHCFHESSPFSLVASEYIVESHMWVVVPYPEMKQVHVMLW
jgi:hypothetical protein